MLEYGSTIEFSSLAFRKRKLKKKESIAVREKATSKTVALFGSFGYAETNLGP